MTTRGVVATAFSWDDPTTWTSAAREVDAVYIVRPDREDAAVLVDAFLSKVPDTARVVLMSEWDAESLGADSWSMQIEDQVKTSGRSWTIVRAELVHADVFKMSG